MSNTSPQSSKFNTLKEWTVYEDLHIQFRVAITVVENSVYIVIAKLFKTCNWIKPNPSAKAEKVASYHHTSKQFFLKPEIFGNILSKRNDILKDLEKIQVLRNIGMFTTHNASLNSCIIYTTIL